MPFTVSHAAAALPFRKLKPVWPALVIGTFAPDLQYFIWIAEEDRSGHHFPDVLLFTMPLALLLLWIFEWIVKGPVIELLPSRMQRRLQDQVEPLSFRGWRQFGFIVLWIAVGIGTHLVWDQFTHGHTWMTAHWSLLRVKVPIPFLYPMPVAKILQNASTLLGLLVLLLWCAAWYLRTSPVPKSQVHEFSPWVKITVVSVVSLIAILAGYPYAMFTLSNQDKPIIRSYLAATVFEAVTLVLCIELLLYGLGLTFAARFRRVPTAQLDEHSS
jgi:uncharacterized protein DUF4184